MSMKNRNDPIGNRSRDLPACSAVPQPGAPKFYILLLYNFNATCFDLSTKRHH